jgi:hypothetical protein
MEARVAMKRLWLDAMANDGRVMEPGVAVTATGFRARKNLQLALDEVFSLGSGKEPAQAGRIRPRENRGELEKFVMDRVGSGAPATYPVLYVKDAPRVAGNIHIATGEIIASLRPGVEASEIARAYDLKALPEANSMVGLTRLVARSAFRALELVPKLAADPRIALVDHDLLKMVEPKAEKPLDARFKDQWAILPYLDADEPQSDINNIGLFPLPSSLLSLLPNAAPVWGDFEDPEGGYRGRGIKVGIVDDGLDLNHPDLLASYGSIGEHRGYDMVAQVSPVGEVLPPRVQGTSGFGAEVLKMTPFNRAHGVNVAGIIGARANNLSDSGGGGIVGVAPNSNIVGLRAFSYALLGGQFEPPDPTFYEPSPGDLISPTQDVIIAAAMGFGQNDFFGASISAKKIYRGTSDETDLPGFGDSGAGTHIHVKNMGFGAPDNTGVVEGRLGLGTVFVQPAGNGRYQSLENVNNDGYANAREAITVGAVTRIAGGLVGQAEDGVSIDSEWGSTITVVAPGAGRYHSGKSGNSRTNNGRRSTAPIATLAAPAIVPIATTDWTVNEPEKLQTSTTPYIPPLFGLNKGGGDGAREYTDDDYTKQFSGSSAAAAHVSGVVALMFEANLRLSWLDVQNILIRTARNHIDADAYALNPTTTAPAIDGLDILDSSDPVVIDQDWVRNGGNVWFNHKYGAGLVNAGRAVAEAERGILLPTQTDMLVLESFSSTQLTLADATASAPGLPGEITLTPAVPPNFVITHVQLRVDAVSTTSIGDLGIDLVSPSGMVSKLLEPRIDSTDDLVDWTFGSLRYWGENGAGLWKVRFTDYLPFDIIKVNVNPPGRTGTPRVVLTIHGYSRPSIPDVSRPSSTNVAAPTVVKVTRGRNFTYSMSASGQPTTWLVTEPLITPNIAGLPPGLKLGTISPSEVTTYLPSRLISGRTTAAVGEIYDIEVVAANAGGLSEVHYLQFQIVPPESNDEFTQWGDFHFPPTAVGNPAANGSADPDGDGLINVLEYGLGTSPVLANAGDGTSLTQDAPAQYTFSFKRYPTRGLIYEVQVSNSLEASSWITVARSNPALVAPDPGAGGVPVSLDANYVVTDGALVAAGDEPQSSHRVVTVVNNPSTPPPLYYRLKVIPPRDPLNPQ